MSHNPGSRRKRSSATVALFPFLAVLVCTMGSLIVVLAVLARQAKLQAAQAATEKTSARIQEIDSEREMVRWRIEQLQAASHKAGEELAGARLELGRLEKTSQELRQKLDLLQAAWNALGRGKRSADEAERRAADAELERLAEKIAEARRALAAAQSAAARPKSYSVVPYHGRSGTQRRPIFIECLADRVVLQPEGIELRQSDFDLLFEPGNPLDRALRAAREAIQAERTSSGEADEPYPLLLVRPEGIAAYYIARAAMLSHFAEVGYELIGDDWKLDYPPASPAVSRAVHAAVEQSRRELDQKRLLLAATRSKRVGPTYRALPGGGLSRELESADEDAEDIPRLQNAKAGDATSGVAGGAASGTAGGVVGGGGTLGGTVGNVPSGGPGTASRSADAGLAGTTGGANPGVGARSPDDSGKRAASGGAPSEERGAAQSSKPAPALRLGEWEEHSRPRRSTHDSAASDGPPGNRPDGPQTDKPDDKKSLAESRGKNWALPDATRGAHPVSRPIRLACHSDRVELLGDLGYDVRKTVPLEGATEQSIDAFVSAVWEHMRSWGIAGRGLYWRPHFSVVIAPGGRQRYDELCELLHGSGMELKREPAP